MILYRPVGLDELLLIYRARLKRFPPRLPGQSIFYPALSMGYAVQIARDWNSTSGAAAGYVTEFEIDDAYAASFEARQVGGREHQEFWVPSESLAQFNEHIVGVVRVVAAFFWPGFVGVVPRAFSLRGRDACAQFTALRGIYDYSLMDFHGEIVANHETVFANFPFWEQKVATAASEVAIKNKDLLAAIRKIWSQAYPALPLGVQSPKK